MHANGMSIVDMTLATGFCDKTIRKWLKANATPSYGPRLKQPSKLDPYEDYIMQRMADGVFNCEVLFREISAMGYQGGKTILKDFVAPFRRQFKVQAVRRFETQPGQQMQGDWGYLGTFRLDGHSRKVWVFALVLGYSRFLIARCTTSMDLESLLLCHQQCLEDVNGVTRQIVYDNMKTVTLGRDTTNRPVWQKRFMDFALYHGFHPVACTPYRPQSKGKVEAGIGYIKKNFCPGRQFADLTDLNDQLQTWLTTVANVRIHATTGVRPVDRIAEESLLPLPVRPFPTAVRFRRLVSRDGFFSYGGILYSVPWKFAGGGIEVEEQVDGIIQVWWHGEVVARHTVPRDRRRYVVDPRHTMGLIAAQREHRSSGLSQCYPDVEKRPLAIYDTFAGVGR